MYLLNSGPLYIQQSQVDHHRIIIGPAALHTFLKTRVRHFVRGGPLASDLHGLQIPGLQHLPLEHPGTKESPFVKGNVCYNAEEEFYVEVVLVVVLLSRECPEQLRCHEHLALGGKVKNRKMSHQRNSQTYLVSIQVCAIT